MESPERNDRLSRCYRELAHLKQLWESGHPDRKGIWAAWEDWLLEEAFIMARPIEATPVLKGKAAERFLDKMNSAEMTPERLRWLEDAARQSKTVTALKPSETVISKIDHLVSEHDIFCEEARNLMVKKNADYANQDDPFRNFRAFGRFGILVRLSDKVARLQSLLENGKAEVKGETIRDTAIDILNYSFLFDAYEELVDVPRGT